jgi:hypothetical protein
MAKTLPFTTGKVFFLVNASEFAAAEFLNRYTNDTDGVARVYTTWASVISAVQANTDYDAVIVSPLFTTPPTKAQQLQLDAAGCVTLQAGQNLPDGSYIAATATAFSLASQTTTGMFAITGRVEVFNLLGEVATATGATVTAKFTNLPTVGSTTDACATGDISGLAVGANISITGTLANKIQTTTQSVYLRQAAPLILTAGTLQFIASQTTTGNVKARIHYKPLDPGAFIAPLV